MNANYTYKAWNNASAMIGELCRDGKTVYYFLVNGLYMEGSKIELIEYLIDHDMA